MAFYISTGIDAEPVPVGIVQATVLGATNFKGYDWLIITLENQSLVETFAGIASCSPNGVDSWVNEVSDEFGSMGPGVSRRLVLPGDRLWARVLGNFGAAPDFMKLTTTYLRGRIY